MKISREKKLFYLLKVRKKQNFRFQFFIIYQSAGQPKWILILFLNEWNLWFSEIDFFLFSIFLILRVKYHHEQRMDVVLFSIWQYFETILWQLFFVNLFFCLINFMIKWDKSHISTFCVTAFSVFTQCFSFQKIIK